MKLSIASLIVHSALHSGKTELRGKKVREYKGGRIKALELGRYKFITQNPDKESYYGELARQGHKITWILYDNSYIGKIIDGILEKL